MPIQLLQRNMSKFLSSERDLCSCWPWQGEIDSDGYGVFNCVYPGGSQRFQAHRSAAIVFGKRTILPNMELFHTCGNKLCCNPGHIRIYNRELKHSYSCMGIDSMIPLSELST